MTTDPRDYTIEEAFNATHLFIPEGARLRAPFVSLSQATLSPVVLSLNGWTYSIVGPHGYRLFELFPCIWEGYRENIKYGRGGNPYDAMCMKSVPWNNDGTIPPHPVEYKWVEVDGYSASETIPQATVNRLPAIDALPLLPPLVRNVVLSSVADSGNNPQQV